MAKLPTIVLVGRTNVGKSTLFNRFLERHAALTSKVPGTTRDRMEGNCLWRGQLVRIVDTGGLDVDVESTIEEDTVRQAEMAMQEADLILFVVDLTQDPTPQERELAARLRDGDVPVIVVGNKAETPQTVADASAPAWRLAGLPSPVPVSALRGERVGDLLDLVYDQLDRMGLEPGPVEELDVTKVAVIGKPNVGKSSLLNAIIGKERFITSPIAHTTREPNDTLIETESGKKYLLIDTAGIRKKGRVKKAGGLEAAGVRRSRIAVQQADVVLFVVEGNEALGSQDKALGGLLQESRAAVIVVANKWDLVEDKETNTMRDYEKYVAGTFPFIRWAPITFVSAMTGQRVDRLFEMIDEVEANRHFQVPEEELEAFWRGAIKKHLPSKGKGPAPPKILGMVQTGVVPPTFKLVVKAFRKDVLHASYVRYLENRLRERFPLKGTPVRIWVQAAKATSKKR